jgi:hypothetical protein
MDGSLGRKMYHPVFAGNLISGVYAGGQWAHLRYHSMGCECYRQRSVISVPASAYCDYFLPLRLFTLRGPITLRLEIYLLSGV